ncbi:hypothetical protein [Rhizobium ruizarguesonis]|uniref:hypothetical protein n=1 Tax=Rhizobium ruizarguesonis TaxID=2081791 RepID=UPI00102FD1DF|nr:hypothetical protein [Rhizobium ruizarguesonis]TBC58292.1 hypothetical protein ELH32_14865 [Rhizobium ruizarguesonis]
MKSVVLAVALLFPSVALAVEAVEVNARDHSCEELAQIIRKDKAVFVRMGFGGRSFRYPPARCNLGDKYDTARVICARFSPGHKESGCDSSFG